MSDVKLTSWKLDIWYYNSRPDNKIVLGSVADPGGDRGDRPPPTQSGKIDLIQEEHVSTHVSQSESGSLTDLINSHSEPAVG